MVSGQRGCSITGNSHDHQQSLRYLRPQAVAWCLHRYTPANHPAECNEEDDNDNNNDNDNDNYLNFKLLIPLVLQRILFV